MPQGSSPNGATYTVPDMSDEARYLTDRDDGRHVDHHGVLPAPVAQHYRPAGLPPGAGRRRVEVSTGAPDPCGRAFRHAGRGGAGWPAYLLAQLGHAVRLNTRLGRDLFGAFL